MVTYNDVKNKVYANKKAFLTFLTIGFTTAMLYFLLFTLLWRTLLTDYNLAVSAAYFISLIFYFFMNRRYTFKQHTRSIQHQLIKFSGMVALNYFITIMIVHGSVEYLLFPPYFAMIAGIGATTMLSFIISKFWVFKVKEQGEC